ncbi:MAG: helix-turn-helix domain-containing protein [Bacteroides sp.]|nr:helix-turn-helix domain-containing protein [Bacillota bacterium]MCM1393628.1 helix-turn-helix domain-containing protein [[Eubacterium] siraeum]MCM1454974.1 helix-turn-helix domain-containing protein [Bacteroides sp.]
MAGNIMNWQDYKNKQKQISEQEKLRIETGEDIARIITDIIEYRNDNGISQRDIAEKTGLKQPAIARMEKLDTMPRLDTISLIANAIGYKLELVEKEKAQESVTIDIGHDCYNCMCYKITASLFNNKKEIYCYD